MKKFFGTSFVLLTLLALTTGTVFAGSVVELVSATNNGGGPTFTFRVSGEFSPSELESGFVTVEGGDSFQLFCSQTDATTVVCHTSKKTSGQNVVVSFGGAKFWTDIPDAWSPAQYCYHMYDFLSKEEYDAGYWQWMDRGLTCQETPASEGDYFWAYSPTFETETWFDYFGQGVDDTPFGPGDPDNWGNPGEGFYSYNIK